MALSVHIIKKLHNFTLRVDFDTDREVLALLGASGCGKSMTLKCIAGVERPDSGRIVLNGRTLFDSEAGIDVKPQERRVGYLFQSGALFSHMTVEENVMTGVRGGKRQEKRRIAGEMLTRLDLTAVAKRKPEHISGGERQRLGLARAFLHDAPFLLLDEPTSNLDSLNEAVILKSLHQERNGKTVVLVSHRKSTMGIADTVYSVEHGRMS